MLGSPWIPRLLLTICAPALFLLMLALLAYYALAPGPGSAQQTTSAATDRTVLVALYNDMDGANWTLQYNWLSDLPIGQWYGVTTDSDGRRYFA